MDVSRAGLVETVEAAWTNAEIIARIFASRLDQEDFAVKRGHEMLAFAKRTTGSRTWNSR